MVSRSLALLAYRFRFHRPARQSRAYLRCCPALIIAGTLVGCSGLAPDDGQLIRAQRAAADAGVLPPQQVTDDQTTSEPDDNADAGKSSSDNGSQPGVGTQEPGSEPGTLPADPDPEQPNGEVEPPSVIAPPLPLHHLTAAEYNTTVAHLLGSTLRPADYFPSAGGSDFDNNAAVLANLPPVLVQGYYAAAKELAAATFADLRARARVLSCDPVDQVGATASAAGTEASADELECAQSFIAELGLRTFRRPLTAVEQQRYVASYQHARDALQLDANGAAELVLRTLLTSPEFFLRVEAAPDEATEHALDFQLASRLSYLLWSSLPDAELFARAAAGELNTTADITREVQRLLQHEHSAGFMRDFVGQWLGLRRLSSHEVNSEQFAVWTPQMQTAQAEQAEQYISGLLQGERTWKNFLSDAHPEHAVLEPLLQGDPAGARAGFLTLPAFLTLSSHGDRTSPTTRATTILGALLCFKIAPPANVDIPDLSASAEDALAEANIRERLLKHREADDCAGCHEILDPIGLSLENYNAIGQFRTSYGDGSAVDATGEYAGVAFNNVHGLVPQITQDVRFARCPTEKLASYALRRSLTVDDQAWVRGLAADWDSGSLDELILRLTTHAAFRPAL